MMLSRIGSCESSTASSVPHLDRRRAPIPGREGRAPTRSRAAQDEIFGAQPPVVEGDIDGWGRRGPPPAKIFLNSAYAWALFTARNSTDGSGVVAPPVGTVVAVGGVGPGAEPLLWDVQPAAAKATATANIVRYCTAITLDEARSASAERRIPDGFPYGVPGHRPLPTDRSPSTRSELRVQVATPLLKDQFSPGLAVLEALT